MRERRVKPNAALYVGYADDDEDIGKALTTPLLLMGTVANIFYSFYSFSSNDSRDRRAVLAERDVSNQGRARNQTTAVQHEGAQALLNGNE